MNSLQLQSILVINLQLLKNVSERFLNDKTTGPSIVLEVFTNSDEESAALEAIKNIAEEKSFKMKSRAKKY